MLYGERCERLERQLQDVIEDLVRGNIALFNAFNYLIKRVVMKRMGACVCSCMGMSYLGGDDGSDRRRIYEDGRYKLWDRDFSGEVSFLGVQQRAEREGGLSGADELRGAQRVDEGFGVH